MVSVAVADGAVNIRQQGSDGRDGTRLVGGERLSLGPHGALPMAARSSDQVATWRSGLIVAENEPVAAAAGHMDIDAQGDLILDTITLQAAGPDVTQSYIPAGGHAATKTDTPLIEVPQVVNVVTRDQIKARGAQTVTEAIRYTPDVVAGFGDSRNDVLQSRGFFTRCNLNGSRLPYGAYSSAFLRIEPYGLERIDVLKGRSSVMYGQTLPGGLIDLTTKRPTPDTRREIAPETGNHDRLQGMFDLSGPIGDDKRFQYRLTGLSRDAGGRIDFGHDRRDFIAPAFTWQPGDGLRFRTRAAARPEPCRRGALPGQGLWRCHEYGRGRRPDASGCRHRL
ncbi:TonB-dependent Receptor Plug Domain [Paracoccus pantotrophus]|nr:TonB-dependent Receptor Plug Domain [Paracoccus pantotrophus]